MYIFDNIQVTAVLFSAYTIFYLVWCRAFQKKWYSTLFEGIWRPLDLLIPLFFSGIECIIVVISVHFYDISENLTYKRIWIRVSWVYHESSTQTGYFLPLNSPLALHSNCVLSIVLSFVFPVQLLVFVILEIVLTILNCFPAWPLVC